MSAAHARCASAAISLCFLARQTPPRCDHISVRRVIAHAHWACTAHGRGTCASEWQLAQMSLRVNAMSSARLLVVVLRGAVAVPLGGTRPHIGRRGRAHSRGLWHQGWRLQLQPWPTRRSQLARSIPRNERAEFHGRLLGILHEQPTRL